MNETGRRSSVRRRRAAADPAGGCGPGGRRNRGRLVVARCPRGRVVEGRRSPWSCRSAVQVGTNYANDYSDGVRGTDERRVGPVRLVASGLASPRAVRRRRAFRRSASPASPGCRSRPTPRGGSWRSGRRASRQGGSTPAARGLTATWGSARCSSSCSSGSSRRAARRTSRACASRRWVPRRLAVVRRGRPARRGACSRRTTSGTCKETTKPENGPSRFASAGARPGCSTWERSLVAGRSSSLIAASDAPWAASPSLPLRSLSTRRRLALGTGTAGTCSRCSPAAPGCSCARGAARDRDPDLIAQVLDQNASISAAVSAVSRGGRHDPLGGSRHADALCPIDPATLFASAAKRSSCSPASTSTGIRDLRQPIPKRILSAGPAEPERRRQARCVVIHPLIDACRFLGQTGEQGAREPAAEKTEKSCLVVASLVELTGENLVRSHAGLALLLRPRSLR